ncbi:MAG TPA: type II secretion system F family protein [Planctomycetaceae bacterium]|nr:type II secretion system F family protein [Planctomycetaceae bacterium]
MFTSRIGLKSLALVCRSLATMLHSGIAVDRAFTVAADKAGDGRCREALQNVHGAIRTGSQVGTAMRDQGEAFPALMIDLVDVGEQTGTLPEVLKSLSGHYENLLRLRRDFRRQIAWPLFQLVAAILVIAVVIVILGWIAESRSGEPLDITGLGLSGESGALMWLVMTFGSLFGLFVAYKVFIRSLSRRKWLDGLLLGVPVVGRCLRSFAIARFSWSFALTQQSGMSIAPSLKASLKATSNGAFIAAGPGIWQMVREGHALSEALAASHLFPREFIETVSVAEASGTVPEMLDHLSPQFEEDARRDLQALTAALGWAVWAAVAVFIIILIFNIFSIYLGQINDALRQT